MGSFFRSRWRRKPAASKELTEVMRSIETETEEVRSRQSRTGETDILETGKVETPELGPLAKLPPFKPVIISLLRLFDREDVPISELARRVEADPALVSELLALVNSPRYGVQGKVATAAHAITMLGLDRTQSVVATLAVRAMMANAPRTSVVRRFWMHSVASAAIANELALDFGVPKDLAHVAAIVHDLGRMGLLAAHTEEYTRLALTAHETLQEILDAEQEQFGMDHCHAGLLLAKAWGLPEILQKAIADHHAAPVGRNLPSLVQFCCRMADAFMFHSIIHRGAQKPAETIQFDAPEELREVLIDDAAAIQVRVIDTIQSLDF